MDPILSLPPDQFHAALAELQLDPQREAELVQQYTAMNGPQPGARGRGALYNLLDNIIGYDDDVVTPGERLGAGVEGFSQGLLSDPIGAASDIVSGGYQTIESAMVPGATPMDVLGAAGMAMGAGGLVKGPRGALRSGLLQDAAAETPAQRVARMLREGRADEVTDDLMAQADPQEMYRLYEAGETGADVPMDYESRMGRAREMGFVDDQYHATFDDFPAFMASETGLTGRGVYTGDDAGDVMDYARSRRTSTEGLNAIPLLAPEGSTYAHRIDWQNTLDADPDLPYNATWQQNVEGMRRAADTMSNQGFPGVHSQPGERVTFNPNRLRSRFARFDPRLSNLENLNAANVDSITGLAAMSASQQNDPLANLRAYIAANGGVLGR
jgi:hypothetical protein